MWILLTLSVVNRRGGGKSYKIRYLLLVGYCLNCWKRVVILVCDQRLLKRLGVWLRLVTVIFVKYFGLMIERVSIRLNGRVIMGRNWWFQILELWWHIFLYEHSWWVKLGEWLRLYCTKGRLNFYTFIRWKFLGSVFISTSYFPTLNKFKPALRFRLVFTLKLWRCNYYRILRIYIFLRIIHCDLFNRFASLSDHTKVSLLRYHAYLSLELLQKVW